MGKRGSVGSDIIGGYGQVEALVLVEEECHGGSIIVFISLLFRFQLKDLELAFTGLILLILMF